MSATMMGRIGWSVQRDKEGHRDYSLSTRIATSDVYDGPFTVLNCPGLPVIGSYWQFGNELDPWAFCWPECSISQLGPAEEAGWLWKVDQKFSTRPAVRCQDQSIENPLLEPPRISGGFSKRTVQGTKNRHNKIYKSSSHTPLRGKELEFEDNRPTVAIEVSTLILPLTIFGPMIDHVNDNQLWGVPKRCIKLSNATWRRLVYGKCGFYYTVAYEFDINFFTFDRDVADVSKKVLAPTLEPDDIDPHLGGTYQSNPKNFVAYIDKYGHNSEVFLDGKGRAVDNIDAAFFQHIEHYPEANFLMLGIPTSF